MSTVPWTLSTHSMGSMDIVHTFHRFHGQCPLIPWKMSRMSMESMDFLQTGILLYKGLKGRAKIPTDDLIPKNRRCRNQHSLAFQIPSASTNAYLHSFFPQTIRDWNELPDSLISSAEMSDDCVSKFTSLVRARD